MARIWLRPADRSGAGKPPKRTWTPPREVGIWPEPGETVTVCTGPIAMPRISTISPGAMAGGLLSADVAARPARLAALTMQLTEPAGSGCGARAATKPPEPVHPKEPGTIGGPTSFPGPTILYPTT